MRLEEGLKEIPVILVTARGEEECVEAGWQSGCSDYITKPINCRELVALIHSHLAYSKAPARESASNLFHVASATRE
jgi:DNA-binding response OmpR family regulator